MSDVGGRLLVRPSKQRIRMGVTRHPNPSLSVGPGLAGKSGGLNCRAAVSVSERGDKSMYRERFHGPMVMMVLDADGDARFLVEVRASIRTHPRTHPHWQA